MLEALIADLRHLEARAASDLVDWLVHLDAKGMADRSIYGYHRQVAKFLRQFPDKPFQEFTDTNIEAFLAQSPRQSRHIAQSILNQWFKWGVKKRRLAENPMSYVDQVRKLPRRPKDIFSDVEVAALEGLPTPDGELYTLLFGTGMRKGEARTCERRNVVLDRGLLLIRGKGDKSRLISLPVRVQQAVADLDLYERLEPQHFLWYKLAGRGRYRIRREAVSSSRIDSWHRRCCAAAGVRVLGMHQTRHTYHHLLRVRGGFSLEERQLLMGHESPDTTQRQYGTLTIEDVARKMSEVEW